MFTYLRKGIPILCLLFSCLVDIVHANETTFTCGKGSMLACDVTLISPSIASTPCGTIQQVTYTLQNNLPVPVPYTFNIIDNGDPFSGAITRDPASTCPLNILPTGSCTLILDLAPLCPASGNFNQLLQIVVNTSQPPLTSSITSPVTSTTPPPPPFTPTTVLHTAANCAILAATTITSTPANSSQIVNGNVCLSPGSSVVGISNADITGGVLEVANPVAQQAQTDLTNAILLLNSQTPCTTLTGDLGNRVLPTGVYCYSTSAGLTNTLTLNGDATSVFIFQIGTTLTANPGSQVVLSGGALAGNVYWVVGTSATLGGLSFQGNILAHTSISFSNPGMAFNGRALASTGAVTLLNNLVTVPAP